MNTKILALHRVILSGPTAREPTCARFMPYVGNFRETTWYAATCDSNTGSWQTWDTWGRVTIDVCSFLNYWRSLHPRGQHFLTTRLLERIHVVPKVLVIEIQEFDILEISKDDLPEVFLQDMYLCITWGESIQGDRILFWPHLYIEIQGVDILEMGLDNLLLWHFLVLTNFDVLVHADACSGIFHVNGSYLCIEFSVVIYLALKLWSV